MLYPFSERIRVGIYDDLYLDLANLHGTLEEVIVEERQASHAEGRAEGLEEGETRFAELTAFLLREGRTEDLTRAVTDLEYRNKLYQQL